MIVRRNIGARLVPVVAALFCFTSLVAPAEASTCLQQAMSKVDRSQSAAKAFDFYEGTWAIRMRQRKVDENLRAVSPWVSFDATGSITRVFQGGGFFEEYEMHKPDGVKYAIGTRLYDPKTNSWAIYWTNKGEGEWQPPARGGVVTKTGFDLIYDDTWGSRAVLTRYRWITLNPDRPTWEQAFSGDCGSTWVANWTMDFTRTSPHK